VATLTPIIRRYALERAAGERFGDFCHRTVLPERQRGAAGG
jgi:sulfite reductase beta subunit-like hemoprotein